MSRLVGCTIINTKALPNNIRDCLDKLLMGHFAGLASRGHFVGGWPSSRGFRELRMYWRLGGGITESKVCNACAGGASKKSLFAVGWCG
jgi:hypothetical protein